MNKKIDFLAVGPQRTGSTWLYESLKSHPQISWPNGVKETFFFDLRFNKGYAWYFWHFDDANEKKLGEVGPTYFDDEDAPQRVYDHNPDCKIVINIRNPIEKTYSVFRHFNTLGEVGRDFQQAVEQMPRIISSGKYKQHCQMWEDLFGGDRVYYLVHDDIKSAPQHTLDRVTDFLELDRLQMENRDSVVNAGTSPRYPKLVRVLELMARTLRSMRLHKVVNFGKSIGLKRVYSGGQPLPPLDDVQTEFLQKTFKDDIAWLENRLDRDFSVWTAPQHHSGN